MGKRMKRTRKWLMSKSGSDSEMRRDVKKEKELADKCTQK
jgi:hypothetical protein